MDASNLLSRLQCPKLEDLDEDDDIIDWVAAYVSEDEFNDTIVEFCRDNAFYFQENDEEELNKDESKRRDPHEHKLEWMELYNKFLEISEDKIENFLKSKGYTSLQLKQRCEEELSKADENSKHSKQSFFMQLLIACSEYEQFIKLMKRSADPSIQFREDFENELNNYHQTIIDGKIRNKIDSEECRKAFDAIDKCKKFLKDFPNAKIQQLSEEQEELLQVILQILDKCLQYDEN